MARKKKVTNKKFPKYMKSKLVVFFGILLACLCALIARLMYIEYHNGEEYKKQVLSKQDYDSQIIPYQRGDIIDANGTVLATSIAVYNVILDCTVMTAEQDNIEPTLKALLDCFPDLVESELRAYATESTKRPYIKLLRGLSYDDIQDFISLQNAVNEKGDRINPNIKGVWFETEYKRTYPYGSLACDVIGFTSAGDVGTTGLENYYDDELNGVNGRIYGYLNSDSDYEKTVIAAKNGNSIMISIDENVQSIVEAKILEFNEAYKNNYRENEDGAENIAVIIQNPNTGEIIAMANYPNFDLSNPRDLTPYYTQDEILAMSDEEMYDALNGIWQNFCVTNTYEPGSVQKPFTVASGLETGKIRDDMTFLCNGYELFGGGKVKVTCVKKEGHGMETVAGSLSDSCNDALMQMSYLIGKDIFLDYQAIFGFGQKTGIDLPGEAYTASLMYTKDNIKPVDLATNSFGQNYNCTMIQMSTAFSSLVNGGKYYQPHLLKKIVDSNGNVVSTMEPVLLKETVSKSTSDLIRKYLYDTVSSGTGKNAKVDGYSMGGKTGTAQKQPRDAGNYLVSFMGFVPYENPQLVIYCIVDTPNTDSKSQAHSTYAQNIVREILKEALPYLNIFPDEELTGANKNRNIKGELVVPDSNNQNSNNNADNNNNQSNTNNNANNTDSNTDNTNNDNGDDQQ